MTKRNALRVGNPHSAESIAYTIDRYGIIEADTLNEILAWLEKHTDEYEYEFKMETISDVENGIEVMTFPTIKTRRKGSFVFKVLDNQHDALNTLENIRNKDFPKGKQGQ